MAKKDSQFKKGSSGNPNGRPKLPEEVRKAAKLTNEQFILVATDFLLMDRTEIQERLQNPKASMLELLVGGIVAKATKEHDHLRATFLLDRTIGKVKETVDLNVHGMVARMSDEDLLLACRDAIQIVEEERQLIGSTRSKEQS